MNEGGTPPGRNRVWLRLALLLLLFAAGAALLYRTEAWRYFVDRAAARAFIDGLGVWGFAGFVLLQATQVNAADAMVEYAVAKASA